MKRYRDTDVDTTPDEQSDGIKVLLGQLRKEIVAGLQYTYSRANANTSRALESATFLYALIELLTEKGVLTIEELDEQKDKIADRVEKRFLSKGMCVVLLDPDQDKYAFDAEPHTDSQSHL